jgi:hypothetical protein
MSIDTHHAPFKVIRAAVQGELARGDALSVEEGNVHTRICACPFYIARVHLHTCILRGSV